MRLAIDSAVIYRHAITAKLLYADIYDRAPINDLSMEMPNDVSLLSYAAAGTRGKSSYHAVSNTRRIIHPLHLSLAMLRFD
jgi:hypothetical protein